MAGTGYELEEKGRSIMLSPFELNQDEDLLGY